MNEAGELVDPQFDTVTSPTTKFVVSFDIVNLNRTLCEVLAPVLRAVAAVVVSVADDHRNTSLTYNKTLRL